jgi:hypothetical protein
MRLPADQFAGDWVRVSDTDADVEAEAESFAEACFSGFLSRMIWMGDPVRYPR